MKKVTLLLAAILPAFALFAAPDQAHAEPTITTGIVKDPSNSYLRGFSEIGFGALFGTIAGGVPFITTLFAKHDAPLALGLGAALYPMKGAFKIQIYGCRIGVGVVSSELLDELTIARSTSVSNDDAVESIALATMTLQTNTPFVKNVCICGGSTSLTC